jgi:replicative DNA helicase
MEMPKSQLHQRLVSCVGRIPLPHLSDPHRMSTMDWENLTAATAGAESLKLFFDDQPALTLMDIRNKARALRRKHGLGLLVVDYLGLMTGGDGDNRVQQIGSYSRGLKALAKELDIPIIVLAQLNRSLEQRPNKRPQMSDLRDSGEIEQDADIILFLYRDEVYNPDTPDRGICEVIIGKQRNGELGRVGLAYRGEFVRFDDLVFGTEFGKHEAKRSYKGLQD